MKITNSLENLRQWTIQLSDFFPILIGAHSETQCLHRCLVVLDTHERLIVYGLCPGMTFWKLLFVCWYRSTRWILLNSLLVYQGNTPYMLTGTNLSALCACSRQGAEFKWPQRPGKKKQLVKYMCPLPRSIKKSYIQFPCVHVKFLTEV